MCLCHDRFAFTKAADEWWRWAGHGYGLLVQGEPTRVLHCQTECALTAIKAIGPGPGVVEIHTKRGAVTALGARCREERVPLCTKCNIPNLTNGTRSKLKRRGIQNGGVGSLSTIAPTVGTAVNHNSEDLDSDATESDSEPASRPIRHGAAVCAEGGVGGAAGGGRPPPYE